jgi:hypothetical protein
MVDALNQWRQVPSQHFFAEELREHRVGKAVSLMSGNVEVKPVLDGIGSDGRGVRRGVLILWRGHRASVRLTVRHGKEGA